MPGVRIVTDSACDLTDDLVKQHDVIVVPLTIRFGVEEFEDRRELSPEEFWRRCQGKGALPETAAPSPGAFIAAYQQAADEGADARALPDHLVEALGHLRLRRHRGRHLHRHSGAGVSTPARSPWARASR